MSANSSNSSNNGGEIKGNTNQISPAIRWCFTLNNYTQDELKYVKDTCSNSSKYYIFGFEVGENGTPHLQGYIEFKEKKRPLSVFSLNRIHWEKSKGNRQDNFNYCSKGGDYFINGIHQKPLKIISCLKDWQKDILEKISGEPDDRKILWAWEEKGGIGKSCFTKYLCKNHNGIVLSGKGADCKHQILEYFKSNGYYPTLIIIDLPRSFDSKFLCYPSFEDIKNGCFFSGKYEGGQVLMNSPHMLFFSNEEPDYTQLSMDRWDIINLNYLHEN